MQLNTGHPNGRVFMRAMTSLVVILLTACATALPTAPLDPKHLDQTSSFVGPNGGTAYLMQCSDGVGCYQRASEVCSNGYVIFDSIDSTNGAISSGSGFVGSEHYIAFECKK
jgi:hypothetical protein